MAGWRERALASLAFGVLAHGVIGAQSLPADGAENASASRGRAGLVAPAAGGAASLMDIEAAVRADAGRAWQIAEAQKLSVSSEDVTWADGSLGCPSPGMAYAQALVPGWRLIVRDKGREAVYHASRGGQWLLCPAGRRQAPLVGDARR